MYKIYINDTPLILMDASNNPKPKVTDDELIALYPGKKKYLLNYIDLLEKVNRFKHITLYSGDVTKLFQDFSAHYKIIEAAGGLVFNPNNELLVIYRRGSWDLPKGKIDPGESKEAAAVREVQEETGIHELQLGQYLGITYHTYKTGKGRRILKLTHWFEMSTAESDLIPQAEEDIEIAEWQAVDAFITGGKAMYNNIRDIIMRWHDSKE